MLVKIFERIPKDWNYIDELIKEEDFEPGNVPLIGDILYFGNKCYKVEERRIYLSSYTESQYFELIVKFKHYV